MDEQGVHAPIVTGTCARCGGKVPWPISSCPHCGAPARFVSGDRAPAARKPGAAGHGTPNGRVDFPPNPPPWPRQNASSFASNDAVYPDDDVHPPPRRDIGRRGMKKGAVLMLAAAFVLIGGSGLLYWIQNHDAQEEPTRSIAARGMVTSNDLNQPAQAPTMPQVPTFSPSSEAPPPSDKASADKNQKLMPLALARAHDGLQKNNLQLARSGISWALSLQPDSPEALRLKQDLLSRERARNAALQAARSCVVQERAMCAWQNANTALSIDSSSNEAKGIAARSMQ
ncbi:hypothetical protein [Caballeronia novacaledonica]|uniref:Uncharacterized protein n=1 Tax=Caballeronia novacaledonica TaxID=1544861 RepID=A0AA37IHS1_9BURK|nr:hypothetical protein [Caballeronia novacaledonica]GJH30051.1 hypothetical protein CBA19CS42_36065 [Caballeronia novacaledonica]